ncbi:MAG: DUF2179 domain-containing protein [Phycisphaerales bacterium]
MPWFIPFLIFLARVGDVSIGTMRVMLMIQGNRWLAAGLGVLEVTIWVLAVREALAYIPNPFAIIGYAGGFAAGTLVGMTIEDKLAFGYRAVRIINPDPEIEVARALRDLGYRATKIPGYGRDGPVEVVFCVIRRRALARFMDQAGQVAPKSFATIERVDRATGGGFDRRAAGAQGPLGGAVRK